MGTTSSALFSGNSRFASDFSTLIDRQVALASLPLATLQNTKSTLSNQSAELSNVDSKVASMQNSLTSLESALGTGSYTASAFNKAGTNVLTTALGSGAVAGSYTVEVTNLGSYASSMSTTGAVVQDPSSGNISSSSSYTLSVGSVNYTVQPAGSGLNGLVAAINNLSGANVQASAVNVGSVSAPDYRLSIQNTQLGANTIQLNDGTRNLLTTQVGGALAAYKVNGVATPGSTSRTVALAPGLNINLVAQSPTDDPTTITVSRSATAVSNALNSFVSSYNSLVDELAQNRGSNTGALNGQSIVNTVANTARGLANYSTDTGTIQSLTQLGLSFDTKGHLALDSATFSSATAGQFSALSAFLGTSGSSGSGFLKAAVDQLNSLEDPTNGVIKTGESSLKTQMTSQDQQITDAQARIDDLKSRLSTQMATADALIAGLEQQYSYLSNLFTAMSNQSKQ